jgi:hypothetical protein
MMCILPTEPVHMHLYRGGTRLLGLGWAKKKRREKMFFRVFKKKNKNKNLGEFKNFGKPQLSKPSLGSALAHMVCLQIGWF